MNELNIGPGGINPSETSPSGGSFGSFGGSSPWSALAEFGIGVVDTIAEYRNNKKNRQFYSEQTDKQNEFNAEQAQIAYDRQRDLYDYQFAKESEYNSPSSQMQRLQAAGLNPYLMLSNSVNQGQVSASPSSVAQASSSSPTTPLMSNAAHTGLMTALNFAQALSQISKTSSDKKLVDANVEKAFSEKKLTDSQRDNVIQATKNLAYELKDILPSNYHKTLAEIDKLISDMNNSQNLTAASVTQLKAQVKQLMADTYLKGRTAKKVDEELKTYDLQLYHQIRDMAYRADIDHLQWDFLNQYKGIQTQMLQSLQSGDVNDVFRLMLPFLMMNALQIR